MPHMELQPGLTFCRSIIVDESIIGPSLSGTFAGLAMPPVFATAFMVGLVEWACVEGLRPYLLEAEDTVGTLVDVSHVAATPIGMQVTVEARLLAVVGRKLRFAVRCHDQLELVGKGSHERTLICAARFVRRAESKRVLYDGLLIVGGTLRRSKRGCCSR